MLGVQSSEMRLTQSYSAGNLTMCSLNETPCRFDFCHAGSEIAALSPNPEENWVQWVLWVAGEAAKHSQCICEQTNQGLARPDWGQEGWWAEGVTAFPKVMVKQFVVFSVPFTISELWGQAAFRKSARVACLQWRGKQPWLTTFLLFLLHSDFSSSLF